MPGDGQTNKPLSGIRVIDFTSLGPGPFFTQCLHDLGADVIKVERPPIGDMGRVLSPGGHHVLNIGKRTEWIDVKKPEGLNAVRKLLVDAHILAEGFRPGVMERLGLSYASVAPVNPGLIYVSISGFGQTGPLALEPGHDLNYLAASGFLSLTEGADHEPGNVLGVPIGDFSGSLYALSSTLAALMQSRATGQGQWLDVSLVDCLTHLMNSSLGHFQAEGLRTLEHQRSNVFSKPGYGVFRSRDGLFLSIAALEDKFYAGLVTALGITVLECDQQEYKERVLDAEHINTVIRVAVAGLDADEVIARLRKADVPVMALVTPNELPTTPLAVARGSFAEDRGIRYARYPVKLDGGVGGP